MSNNHRASANLTAVVTLLSLALIALPCASHSLDSILVKALHLSCPQLDPEVHHGLGVAEDITEKREVVGSAQDLNACVSACCSRAKCGIAVLQGEVCLALECHSIDACHLRSASGSLAVVVQPAGDADWVLPPSTNETHVESKEDVKINRTARLMDLRCEIGLNDCGQHGVCEPLGDHHKNGHCRCKGGYYWEAAVGDCVVNSTGNSSAEGIHATTPTLSNTFALPNTSSAPQTPPPEKNTSSKPQVEKLVVNINNKTVELAEGSSIYESKVTLSAYAIGGDSDCKYEWMLLQRPKSDDTGSVSDLRSQTITLMHLSQGVYVFKVEVTAAGAHGEAVGNVTVKPAQHTNQPPKAIIVAPSQAIKLPTSGVIIDGSASTDDDGIESFAWEVVTAPLGYKLKNSEQASPTLQLTDLIAGNYTIMLRVKDKEGLEGNATTLLTVIKETDYPPTANAGGDQIIYLPQTETILYGNMSTDDHGIEEWEWTKGPKDSGKAVDMQDTRTAFLHLSNLEEGHYQFILRVTDGLHQSSNTSVSVYVQQPNLAAPKANAGPDVQIVLPNTTVLLDGTGSTDTSLSTHWLWIQVSGPSVVHLATPDQPQTYAVGLTKGEYQFQLTVWTGDEPGKNTSDLVAVTVRQDHNVAPTANAGGDFSVTLPVSAVVVDGSKSTDDVAVTKWLWQRDATSLAAGQIINSSDHSPVLMFTGVVAGRYVWRLTVWDDQGASSSDTVSIIVNKGPHHLDEVTVVVGADLGTLSTLQLSTLLQKMELFLHTADRVVTIHLISLTGLPHSGQVSVTFVAQTGKDVVPGVEVVATLHHQVLLDSSELLDLPLLSVDTVVCQNNCSGHGECVEASRECHCHTWWMESFFRRHLGDGMQNCDWSVIYVFVIICMVVLVLGLVVWGMAVLVGRRLVGNSRTRRKPLRYSLLSAHDESMKCNLLDSASESNSDVEIHFDSRMMKHKAEKSRNGYHKLPRIRT
ncbi:hypothetical protein O3P69_015097 [Scylla paramamosain]|uniref:PKD/Chitinase domain-containing protein n=1 Tax=Scylla paramamosain TaxID=85552 RepID=A0AAW0T2R5_SCYPA